MQNVDSGVPKIRESLKKVRFVGKCWNLGKDKDMSRILITEQEYRRFENIIFKVWRVYRFGETDLTDKEIKHINEVLKKFSTEHHREYKIIIRHHLKHVYYTTIAREQGVSEGYIRKLAKKGAYYFLQLYDNSKEK